MRGSHPLARPSTRIVLQAPPNAQPQYNGGNPLWAEHWGLTKLQLTELLLRLRGDPRWDKQNSVSTMVTDFIVPWTRGLGYGYALLVNVEEPKVVNVMVSHAWAEPCEEFLECVIRTLTDFDVVFICALSLYQCEDAAGPTIEDQLGLEPWESPFRRVLEHIRARGQGVGWSWRWRSYFERFPGFVLFIGLVLSQLPVWFLRCAPALTSCLVRVDDSNVWIWQPLGTIFETFLWICLTLLVSAAITCYLLWTVPSFNGRMVVVPNRTIDIYSRLWCCYEIFVAKKLGVRVQLAQSLASAGRAKSRSARCSNSNDEMRIVREIETFTTWAQLDHSVFIASHGAWLFTAEITLLVAFVIASCDMTFNHLLCCPSVPSLAVSTILHFVRLETFQDSISFAVTVLISKIMAWFSMFAVFARHQGEPTRSQVSIRCVEMLAMSSPFVAFGVVCMRTELLSPTQGLCILLMGTTIAGYALFMACVLFLSVALPTCVQVVARFNIICLGSVALLIALTMTTMHITETPFYPALLGSTMSVLGTFFLPAFLCWYGSTRWGVRFQVSRRVAPDSDSEFRSDSESSGSSE